MSVHHLDKMFDPGSVAVVGASDKKSSLGTTIMNNLVLGDFQGEIYPVHPKHRNIGKIKAWPSVSRLPQAVDLVIIATPIDTVPQIVREAAEKGCGGAIIISAGGKETGASGADIEEAIRQAAAPHRFRIIGPNCLGIISTRNGLNASFAGRTPRKGKMAFISQSGAICTSILDFSAREHIGFSYFVSLGSMLDVDFGDVIDYLGSDPAVSSIILYIESLTRIRNFMSAARAVSRVKPIIALKAGRTSAGSRAAASHTGAMTGEDAVYDVALKRAGIVRVKTFQELFDCAEFLAKQPKPTGPGLIVVTNAGGPGVMAADSMADYGHDPVPLTPDTIARLDAVLPPHWSRSNPVDILGDASPERYRQVVEILSDAPEVNGLLIMLAPQGMTEPTRVAEVLVDQLLGKPFPVFTAWMGGLDVEPGRGVFNRAGISTFDTPERAIRAFMDLLQYARNNEMLQEIPPALSHRLNFDRNTAGAIISSGLNRENGCLDEIESKALMSAYGIKVNDTRPAADEKTAVALAEEIGFPVAMKVYSADILHKTDAGGVILNIDSPDRTRRAFEEIINNCRRFDPRAVVKGVTIQKMLPAHDYELIVGAKKDRDFGPVLLFGNGGIFTEILRDRALALPPVNRLLARRMMEETEIFKVLKGYRNRPGADLDLLEEVIIRLSQLVCDFSQIETVDINPLLVSGNEVLAVDARVIVAPSDREVPHHLVISPYPNQHEQTIQRDDIGELLIRPIRPEDAPLIVELFAALSPQSIYNRFFSPLKTLPHHMLARFTQINYDREIALVAVARFDGRDRILGVARVVPEHNQKDTEFAVLVADEWHGKGIGAALLRRCLELVRNHHYETVKGIVLADNTKMLDLGRRLGFSIKRISGTDTYELSIKISRIEAEEEAGSPDQNRQKPGHRRNKNQSIS